MKDLNAANVMVAVRDHLANNLDSLCKVIRVPPSYGEYQLESVLRRLVEAGLLVRTQDAGSTTYEVAPEWYRIQEVLDISLTKLGQAGSDSITVTPLFGKPAGIVAPLDLFVVMPFNEELDEVYENHIKGIAKSKNLSVKHAKEFSGVRHIMADIWEAMNAARLVIADCTGHNPNVCYEIGIAHTLGKKVILITQNKDDIPFDLVDIRYIKYTYTAPGMKQFEENLLRTLQTEMA